MSLKQRLCWQVLIGADLLWSVDAVDALYEEAFQPAVLAGSEVVYAFPERPSNTELLARMEAEPGTAVRGSAGGTGSGRVPRSADILDRTLRSPRHRCLQVRLTGWSIGLHSAFTVAKNKKYSN